MVVRNVLGGEGSQGGKERKGAFSVLRKLFFTQWKGLRFTFIVGCYELSRLRRLKIKIVKRTSALQLL